MGPDSPVLKVMTMDNMYKLPYRGALFLPINHHWWVAHLAQLQSRCRMIKLIIKILITVAILAFITVKIDLTAVFNVVRNMPAEFFVYALVMQLLSVVLASYRWYLIMKRLAFVQGPMFFLKSYLKGSFFNQALPGGIGGDAYRVIECAALGYGKKSSFYGVLLDRILGLIGILLLNLLANVAHSGLLPLPIFHLLNIVALGGIGAVIIFALLGKIDRFSNYKFTRHLHEISADLRRVYHDQWSIAFQSVLSVLIHFVSMLAVYFIGIGVGLNYDLLTFLVLVPPVMLLTIAPISLAGWGVREGGMIGLFMLIGADKALVLSMSVLYGLILFAASLPGLYLFLINRQKSNAK